MRIAVLQALPQPLDVAGNLRRLDAQMQHAAADGAQLLVCPEMFLSGYDIGRAAVDRLAEAADGASAQAIARFCRAHALAVLYGYAERGADGRLYNSVQLIDSGGQRLGNYRKTHLFGQLDRAQFSAGEAPCPIIELNGWKLGLLICYDIEFPENARQLALAGAELILVPTANMAPYDFVCQVTVRARAQENQCYLVYANYCGQEGGIAYCGQSSVVGPDGSFLALAERMPCRLLADIDRQQVLQGRAANPYLADLRRDLRSTR